MSELSQEQRPQSRFRLARLETTGARLPALARPVPVLQAPAPVRAAAASDAMPAPFRAAGQRVSASELEAVPLLPLPIAPAWVEQAETLIVEAEPPAPVAGPVPLAPSLTAVSARPAAPLGVLRPRPFTPVTALPPPADLKTLHVRIVNGPKPEAKRAEAAAAPALEPAKPEAPKPKISIRPVEPARPDPRRTAPIAARSNAQPVELPASKPPAPQPSPEPKVIPIRKPEPAPPVAREPEAPVLGLPAAPTGSSMGSKIGMAAAALLVLVAGGYFIYSGRSAPKAAVAAATPADVTVPLAPLGGGGWTSNWGSEAAANKGKQISIYRPSTLTPDYRIELHGQIESKAIGWVFRAKDPKNYYVMKLVQVKPGIEPAVALVKYAVINGKESTHTQVLMQTPATMTTLWRIRTDVKGNRFTTSVQDQVVDYWTDGQHATGGAGLYVDRGERALIKTTNISALR